MREREELYVILDLMRRDAARDRGRTPHDCRQCCYHHPDFRYRRCLFTSCPYGRPDSAVFRRKPLSVDCFPFRKGVV